MSALLFCRELESEKLYAFQIFIYLKDRYDRGETGDIRKNPLEIYN